MIKTLLHRQPTSRIRLVMNMVKSEAQAITVAEKIIQVTRSFVGKEIRVLGYIPRDEHVQQAVMHKQPLMLHYPACPAARQLKLIARRLLRILEPPASASTARRAQRPRNIFSRFIAIFKPTGST